MPRLVVFDDSVRGVDLPKQPLIIGRSNRSDIPIHDRLLSRKHCAIVPFESGYRLVDLKSSYGTYLNGSRIERVDLSFDDIIEIGSTVMVFLDTAAWNRGEGLTRLRNPLKAQELIQKINRQSKESKSVPVAGIPTKNSKSKKPSHIMDMLPILMGVDDLISEGDEKGSLIQDEILELLVDYASFKTISLWIRERPDIKRLLTQSVESALQSALPGNWEEFRVQLREEINQGLLKPSGNDSHENNGRGGNKGNKNPDLMEDGEDEELDA